MGGFGSGKGYYKGRRKRRTKALTTDLPELDVSDLIKRSKKEPNAYFKWNGFSFHPAEATIRIESTVTLKANQVKTGAAPCHFGGFRYFAYCPRCNKKIKKLYYYKDIFACRHCFRMAYPSQNDTLCSRLRKRTFKVFNKLNRDDLKKPKGMWRKTHRRLREELDTLERMCDFADFFSLKTNYAARAFMNKYHLPEFVPMVDVMVYSGRYWYLALR